MDIRTIIFSVVNENLKSLFNSLFREFGEEIKQIVNNNILEYQVEEYNRNYCAKTLLHRIQPKILKEFYQPLFITQCQRRVRNLKQKRIPTDSIKELFSKAQFITILGSAGSGESTILKYLFINSIDTKFKIPIKIELRYLNDYNGSIIEYVNEKIFKLNKIATNQRIIERLMNSGDFTFFLDGYDEVTSSKKEKLTKEIDDLVKIYNKNYYLLTSRPYTEIDLLPLFHNYQVCELTDADINHFIRRQIPYEEKELCDKMIEAINNKENSSYKSFLSNPLLLSMFILTFQSYSNIPQKRSEFYSQVFDTLFSVHDSMSKLAFVREKQSGLAKEQIIEVLKLFSFLSYFDEKFIFSSLYLEEKLNYIKEKKKSISFDNTKLINDLQVAIGILNKEGTDFAFPHRSLQEYFSALYIAYLSEENKKVIYKKIIDSLSINEDHRRFSRENFYYLLAELDEKSLIKYALIPFFEKFEHDINLNEKNPNIIFTNFTSLHYFFVSFDKVLNSKETMIAFANFNHKFEEYFDYSKEVEVSDKLFNKRLDAANKKLALHDIKPFLKKFLPKVDIKKQMLIEYLINEINTDSEIISLI